MPDSYDHPKSHLVLSILNTVFCCFPIGIAAIIFSVKTRDAKKYSDPLSAHKYSKKAKKFNILAFSIGCFFFITWLILSGVKISVGH